jgi:hypothetical protein
LDTSAFYLEQYKALREEIISSIGQIYATEAFVVIVVLAVYGGLLLSESRISVSVAWFVPPVLIVACAVHCLMLALRISTIAKYLAGIEEIFGTGGKIQGWEHYKLSHGWIDKTDNVLAALGWMAMFAGSIVLLWWRTRKSAFAER